jgi:hypothetical protein
MHLGLRISTWPPVQPQFNYIMWQVLIRLNPELGAGGMAGSIPTWPPVQPQFNYILWQVLIRLNPELGAGGGVHPYLATGAASV